MNPMIQSLKQDPDFQALIRKYKTPNCFDIMGRTRREEWHSNFLCWFLDPSANHELGSGPLRMFFTLLNKHTDQNVNPDKLDLEQVHFLPEFSIPNGRIDIFGENETCMFLIENKIDALETWGKNGYQTDLYFQYFTGKKEYEQKQKYFVYLRPRSGNRPSNPHFIPITYQELFDEVLFPCLNYKNITDETKYVLEQYAASMSNPVSELHMAYTEKILAEKIWKKHNALFDLIRSTMNDIHREEASDVCLFFEEYKGYLNEILGAVEQPLITKATEVLPTGNSFLKLLCDTKIIIPDQTELIFERKGFGVTYIIQLGIEKGEYYCQTGYYEGSYTGKELVEIIFDENENSKFHTINKAAQTVEIMYKKHTGKSVGVNDGPPAGLFRVFHSGKTAAEGKTIDEIKREIL